MSIVQSEIIFSKEELQKSEGLRKHIVKTLDDAGFGNDIINNVVVQMSFDGHDNMKWGNVYVDVDGLPEDRETVLWGVVEGGVEQYCMLTGLPSSLIAVRPA